MGKPFTVNMDRYDPFKPYRFLVYFGGSTSPVAGVSKVTGLKRMSDVIEYKQGGDPITRKGLGRTRYEPITMERGVTFDEDFEAWANAAQVLSAAGAMGGASDHGVSKSLYGQDPDGNEFEIV